MSSESLRKALIEQTGETILYIWEVENIVNNLGSKYVENTIRRHLNNSKLRPQDHGVNPTQHGIDYRVMFYLQSSVWEYLQSLAERGKIQLTERRITNFEDILELEYHKIRLGFGGSRGGRIDPHMEEEPGPSWDNVVRAYEEQDNMGEKFK